MLVKSAPRMGDYVVTIRLGTVDRVRVGKVVKLYPGRLGRLFVGLATENPYSTVDDVIMDSVIRLRKYPPARRPRVTYNPFLPLYGWKGRKVGLLLGSPRLWVFPTQKEAYDMVYDFVDSGHYDFYTRLRIKSVLRR